MQKEYYRDFSSIFSITHVWTFIHIHIYLYSIFFLYTSSATRVVAP